MSFTGRSDWCATYLFKSAFLIQTPVQQRDDLEDQELNAAQIMEGMPTTVSGFKDPLD